MIPRGGPPPGLESPGLSRREGRTAAAAGAFARDQILPVADALDRRLAAHHDHFPWDLVRAGARQGWLSACVPRIFGGGGVGIAEMALAMEELCAVDAGVANVFGAHALGMLPLMLAGDLDLCARVLGDVCRAEREARPLLCAFAITEPGGGSDVEEAEGLALGDVRSYAVRVAGGYRLHGRKVFISNGNVAGYVAVFAALDRHDPRASWTGFVVREGSPGFHCARTERKLGQRACPAAELGFEDVFVPEALRLGAEGSGGDLSRRVLAVSRGPVGAIAVGIARGAVEAVLEHLRATGIDAANPWVEPAVARMIVALRVARAAYLEAARHCDAGLLPGRAALELVGLAARAPIVGAGLVRALQTQAQRGPRRDDAWAHQAVLGATAKVAASDAAMVATTVALDIIPPGAGPTRARAERAFRDAKLTQIYEGTNQINLRAIGHESWRRGSPS